MNSINHKIRCALYLAMFCPCLWGCNTENEEDYSKQVFYISGDVTFEYPAVGRIHIDIEPDPGLPGGSCTGTLISDRHVLTAKHCCIDEGGDLIRHELDYFYYEVDSGINETRDITGYSIMEPGPDICVVTLASPVTLIVPMKVWPDILEYLGGRPIIQVGYGITCSDSDRCPRDDTKRIAYNTIRDYKYGKLRTLSYSAFGGDSGGPAIVITDSGTHLIAGVLSRNRSELDACDWHSEYVPIVGDVYTFIADEISSTVGVLDADGDGEPDGVDNCPSDPNPPPFNGDSDADGRGNACDNCRIPNPDQVNSDVKWHGFCRYLAPDEWGNACDNCPSLHTASRQSDADGDGIGNACDLCPDQHPELDICDDESSPDCYHPPNRDDYRAITTHTVQEDRKYIDDIGDIFDFDYGQLYRTNDDDLDGIGNICDNCSHTPNAYQANCNYIWEFQTRKEKPEDERQDFLGDACDSDPCTDVFNMRASVVPSTAALERVCEGDPVDPAVNLVYADIQLRNAGFNVTPPYTSKRWDVVNGYCHCGGYHYIRDCRLPSRCNEIGEVDPTRNWHYMRREDGHDVILDVKFTRTYGGFEPPDPPPSDPIYDLVCQNSNVPGGLPTGHWGCEKWDFNNFYKDTGTPGPGFDSLKSIGCISQFDEKNRRKIDRLEGCY